MAGLVAAFEEVGPPGLVVDRPGDADPAGNQREGNEEAETPGNRFGEFRLDAVGQGMEYLDFRSLFGGQSGIVGKAGTGASGIADVVDQVLAVAAEFKVEISLASGRFDEKFDATVLADAVLEMVGHTADKTVLHLKQAVEAEIVVLQLAADNRPVIAAFGTEIFDFNRVDIGPARTVPAGGEINDVAGVANVVAPGGTRLR